MSAKIKNLAAGQYGIEFEIRNSKDEFLGDLYVTNTGLIWCEGKTQRENGISVNWKDFIEWMNDDA